MKEEDESLDETLPSEGESVSASDETVASTPDDSEEATVFSPTEVGTAPDPVDPNVSGHDLRRPGAERYTIGAELARGGMGAVLSAKDLSLRREIAMKIVLDPKAAKDSQIVRFVHEAQVTGQLEHPSIVPVYELGVDENDHVYYTMKFIRGTNLGDIFNGLRDGEADTLEKYPLARLLNIFIKACDALAFAHSRGVIHRDLKPDNIMVGDFGEVLIVDWGLAKVLGKEARVASGDPDEVDTEHFIQSIRDGDAGAGVRTMDGAVMGTPAYMPPEQAVGDLSLMGPASDVYSMGGILYTMLTLKAPIQGESVREILTKVQQGDITPPIACPGPHAHCPDGAIPASLSAVVMKAMATDPAARYEVVQKLQIDVRAYLDGFATSAEGASLWRLAKLFVARHRALCLTIVVVNLLLMGIVAVAFGINVRARHDAEDARVQAERSSVEAEAARGRAEAAQSEANEARGEAVETLRAITEEQARGKAVRRKGAPAMVRAGYRLSTQGDLEGAALQAKLACEYDPDLAAAHRLTAQLAMVDENYDVAREAIHEVLRLLPEDPAATQLSDLCDQESIWTGFELNLAVMRALGEQQAWALGNVVKEKLDREYAFYEKRALETWRTTKKPNVSITRGSEGLMDVAIHLSSVTNLAVLVGMPVGQFNMSDRKDLSDLTPLAGLPLRRLSMYWSGVSDISPLAGLRLTHLDMNGTRVADLRPLAGMPLRQLIMNGCPVKDLSPLKGAPIESLFIGSIRTGDVSALADMPLRELDMGHLKVEDLAPLATCRDLTRLVVRGAGTVSLEPLRGLPLEYLWLECEGGVASLTGMPLRELVLTTPADSLEPLHRLPLHTVTLGQSAIKDLSFLRDSPVRSLKLDGLRQLKDLSALRDRPLVELRMSACPAVSDLQALRSIKTLEVLTVPEQFSVAETLAVVGDLPKLRRLGNTRGDRDQPPTLEEFRARLPKEKADKGRGHE